MASSPKLLLLRHTVSTGSKVVARKDVFPLLAEPVARLFVCDMTSAAWKDFGIVRCGVLVKLLNIYTCRRLGTSASFIMLTLMSHNFSQFTINKLYMSRTSPLGDPFEYSERISGNAYRSQQMRSVAQPRGKHSRDEPHSFSVILLGVCVSMTSCAHIIGRTLAGSRKNSPRSSGRNIWGSCRGSWVV